MCSVASRGHVSRRINVNRVPKPHQLSLVEKHSRRLGKRTPGLDHRAHALAHIGFEVSPFPEGVLRLLQHRTDFREILFQPGSAVLRPSSRSRYSCRRLWLFRFVHAGKTYRPSPTRTRTRPSWRWSWWNRFISSFSLVLASSLSSFVGTCTVADPSSCMSKSPHHGQLPGRRSTPDISARAWEQAPCRSPGKLPPGQPALPSLLQLGACAFGIPPHLAVDVRKDLAHEPCAVAVLRRKARGHLKRVRRVLLRHPSVLFPGPRLRAGPKPNGR